MAREELRRPKRTPLELAAAVGAHAAELRGALGAEGALERADEGRTVAAGQIPVAAFAVGAEFEHACSG